ncbi:3-ketoacyl-ACP reductase [Maribacter algarum]|uniref:3-ketoacyl-ACP reductase n=1 Tax=Maribacter algarum (ex Zhang et al. 2020) TaxID=2578118 RepID=A0A5S3PUA1_9FLAO|nr:3-ketoacyl-ACP reductase [Maribacter algarum]TMM58581.1 3-ketoacyl-ACP reductase [Maribacter algarum]
MKKNVLITGGSRGIGLGIAKELAALGCNLAINGVRPEDEVKETLDMLRQSGTKAIYCQGDVSSAGDRSKIIQGVLDEFKSINVLVNNAGVAPKNRADLLDVSEESYDRLMNINLRGPFFLTQMVAKHMASQKANDSDFQGSIINISSVSAIMASPNRGEYCISKAGMSMMTKLFAVKLGEHDIPVYEVQPGVIKTDMTTAVQEKYEKQVTQGLTIEPRLGFPEDVGKVVGAIVENKIPYATGQVFTIDGGLSLLRF